MSVGVRNMTKVLLGLGGNVDSERTSCVGTSRLSVAWVVGRVISRLFCVFVAKSCQL